jgi:hypothetical protein
LSCISNEEKSDSDIFEMGVNFTFEVEDYIDNLKKKAVISSWEKYHL